MDEIVQIPNAMPFLPDRRSAQLMEMFPDFDIPAILTSFPTQSVETVANWILSTPAAPKKRRPQKRPAEHPLVGEEDIDMTDDEINEGLVLHQLCKDLFANYRRGDRPTLLPTDAKTLLSLLFPSIRMDFFSRVFTHSGDFCSTIIASWFISNKCTQQFQDLMNEPANVIWLMTDPIQTRRRNALYIDSIIPPKYMSQPLIKEGVNKFHGIMNGLTKKYPLILNRSTLLDAAFTLKIEIPEDIETFECIVCFTEKNVTGRIICGNDESTATRHSFCRTCLRGHASAAAQDMPLAAGAVGFKCMDYDCTNAIYYSTVRSLIPKEIRRRLDDRILEENLNQAGLNLERCRECNFAVEMEETVEQNKVFNCQNCDTNWCRMCHRKWDDDHVGISCMELDAKNSVDRKQRDLEAKMNEIVVRRCHRCNVQFTKMEGCNKIRCRCGATQCYVCKKQDIDYNHFCRHVRQPGDVNCKECKGPSCSLWEDVKKRDEGEIDRMQQEAGTSVNRPKSPVIGDRRMGDMAQMMWPIDERHRQIMAGFQDRRRENDMMPVINVQIGGDVNVDIRNNVPPAVHRHMLHGRDPFHHDRHRFDDRHLYMAPRAVRFYAQRQPLGNQNGRGVPAYVHPPPFGGRAIRMNAMRPAMLDAQERQRREHLDFVGVLQRNQQHLQGVNRHNLIDYEAIEQEVEVGPERDFEDYMERLGGIPPGDVDDYIDADLDEDVSDGDVSDDEVEEEDLEMHSDEDSVVGGLEVAVAANSDLSDSSSDSEEDEEPPNPIHVIDLEDEEDAVQVLNQVRPKNTPIATAVDRLGNGAEIYEMAPINDHERYFNFLVDDSNAVLDFSAQNSATAAGIFLNTVVHNNPELRGTEVEGILREFSEGQRRFAELAARQKQENLVLLERFRAAIEHNQGAGNQDNVLPRNNDLRPPKVEAEPQPGPSRV